MVGCPSVRPSVPSIGWFAAERPAYAAYQLSVCCWRPRSAANAGSVMSKAGFKGRGQGTDDRCLRDYDSVVAHC